MLPVSAIKNRSMKKTIIVLLLCASGVLAQSELLTNSHVIEMFRVGLPSSIILQKIRDSENRFDVTVGALIELRKSGIDADIIALMLERAPKSPIVSQKTDSVGFSDSVPVTADATSIRKSEPRTIAIEKSSIHPSRQALEKELLKRKEWPRFNFAIVRYKESADYYIEIGRVPLSLVTHRYAFRVYDRRSGTVIAAGETTSWGSLAENMAREIAKALDKVIEK